MTSMTKERILFLIGIWVMLLPHLGFPNSFRKFLFFVTGIFIIYISYHFRKIKRSIIEAKQESTPQMKSYVDNINLGE